MEDARSKVTLRPRSKLERIIEVLSDEHDVPSRPQLDLVTQLALLQLVVCGADGKAALVALRALCAKNGAVDPDRLADATRESIEAVVPAPQVDDTLRGLRAVGELARSSPGGLDARCRGDLAEARRLLRTLPAMTEQRADKLLLQAGIHPLVAPTGHGLQVAARLGYPGNSYAAFARALDEELPDHNAVAVAWRAHHLLDQHGRTTCGPKSPACGTCAVRDACAHRGEGDDPAARLSWRAPPDPNA